MSRSLSFYVLGLAVALGASPATAAKKPKVALLEIEALQGVPPGTAKILTNLVAARVGDLDRFEVLTSSEIASMIGFERQKKLLGCSETNCLAEIGGALGSDYLLTGQVGRIGSRYNLHLTLSDTRQARVIKRQSELCQANDDVLVDVVQKVVGQLFAPVIAKLDAAAQAPAAAPVAPATPPAQPVAAAPAPVPAPAPSAPAASIDRPAEPPARIGAWVASAATVALAGGGAYCGLTAKSRYDSLKNLKTNDRAAFDSSYSTSAPGISQMALYADILYGAALAGAAISGWLWLRNPDERTTSVSVLPSSGGASLAVSGSF